MLTDMIFETDMIVETFFTCYKLQNMMAVTTERLQT